MLEKTIEVIILEIEKNQVEGRKLWADFSLSKEFKDQLVDKFEKEKKLRVEVKQCPRLLWDIIIYFK